MFIHVLPPTLYTGEEIAFYFGWMDFYSTCILVPLVVGLAMYLVRGKETTVDTDPYLPLFSVFMAIWAVLFLVVRTVIHACCYGRKFLVLEINL